MRFSDIRQLMIVAVCADDWLMNRLVLKGGSPLASVAGIRGRASVDVEFSLDGDFEDFEEEEPFECPVPDLRAIDSLR